MNQTEKDSLISLLNQDKDVYQDISRRIHWTTEDAENLDNLMESRELQSNIANRIMRVTRSRIPAEIVPLFLIYKAWQRTKAVYSFTHELVGDMAQTDDTSIYVSLLERLPFKDMLFFFPKGVLPKLDDEETASIYVHIERHPEHLWTIFHYHDRDKDGQVFPGIVFAFPITDGMKISQVFETPQYQGWLSTYKRRVLLDRHLSEQEAEKLLLAERKVLNTAINLMYYLSSKNADIKEIRHHKNRRKTSIAPNDESTPAIKHHEVGTQYAEIVYRQFKEKTDTVNALEDQSTDSDDIHIVTNPKKRRPHARMAHWQHYWTGEGRKILEVRWKSDIFVGANRDDQATIVYGVDKPSLKGKQNPNTSKKKRDK